MARAAGGPYPRPVLAIPCPSCGALVERGVLRCRYCNADARAASRAVPARRVASARAEVRVPPAPRGRLRPDRSRELEELVALSRELFLGP